MTLGGIKALWRYRRPFAMEHFVSALHMQPGAAARHPVLSSFIAQVSSRAWVALAHKHR
jgi:hypothetical protein